MDQPGPSIERRDGPRGPRFRIRLTVDTATGRRQRTFSFESLAKAEDFKFMVARLGADRAAQLLDDETARDAPARPDYTVQTWTERHIEQLTGVTRGTRSDYRAILEKTIAPLLGELPLKMLGVKDVTAWINNMERGGLSGKTIKNRHALLSSSLESACRAGEITLNVAKGVRLPRQDAKTREATFLTPGEYKAIEVAMKPGGVPLLILMAQTGMRIGEAIALRVRDVDLSGPDPVVRVVRAVKHTDDNTTEYGPPKSAAGRRSITLFDTAADYIAGLIGTRRGDDLLTLTSRGTPWRPNHWRESYWHPAVEASGIGKHPTPHDLRHSHASWLIARGVALPVIQHRLGHDDINVTVRVYGHLTADLHRGAAAAIGDAIGGRRALPPA